MLPYFDANRSNSFILDTRRNFFFTLYSRLHENEVVEASAPIYCLVCAISKIDTEKLDGISFFQVA